MRPEFESRMLANRWAKAVDFGSPMTAWTPEMLNTTKEQRKMTKHACMDCKHCHKETESWEMPHIFWYECSVRTIPEEARFPYKSTTCKKFEPRPPARSIFDQEVP